MFFEEVMTEQLNTIPDILDKIYPLNAEEGIEAPYIVYLQAGGNEYKSFDGYSGLKKVLFEFNILHNSYTEMKYLTKTVVDKIIDLEETVINGLEIQGITLEEPVELFEKEIELYRSIITIRATYIERIW